ncbi:ABC transporter permease subunit [Saccharopolyspora griseoalba]|uniref:ABC transporter permease subunit n=1 Tax=Saccharopolyspora griseoalba TaxID=1431848 RepID=A0ABW2LS65_9PSEU
MTASALAAARGAVIALGSVVGLALVVGALPWLSGDDPAQTVLRARSAERELDPAVLAAIRQDVGIPDDAVSGALGWLAGALHGDLGRSWVSGAPVADSIVQPLGISLSLAASAAVVCLVCALLLLAPSLRRAAGSGGGVGGGALATGALLGALPEFLVGTALLTALGVHLGLAPTSGWSGPENIPLPALALGLPAAGVLGRVLSGAVDATLAEPWVRTWRAAGFRRATTAAAVLRRAVAVALPQVVLLFVGLLGSGIVVETLFAIPGLGSTALEAVLAQDLPVVQACVALLTLIGLALGAAGMLAHRRLLGPAMRDGALTPGAAGGAGHQRWALVVTGLLVALVVAGLLRDPSSVALSERLGAPSAEAPFGTDELGRDLLARFGHGALLSIGAALAISAIALVLGLLVGTARARALAALTDVLNAVPPVLAGIIAAAVAGPGLLGAGAAVCAVAWIPLAVHARTLAAEVRAAGFVRAARALGAGRARILLRHVLPVILPPLLRHALVRIPHNALALAGLGFLGLAAPHDSAEWGAMLSTSLPYAESAPWAVAVPALGLALLGLVAGLARTGR